MIYQRLHWLNFFKKTSYESSVRRLLGETVSIFLNSMPRSARVPYYRGDALHSHGPVECRQVERCVHYMTTVLGLEM